MSNSVHAPASTKEQAPRRPWTAPRLVVHESMMVLTQSFFGAPVASMVMALQGISCVVGQGGPGCP